MRFREQPSRKKARNGNNVISRAKKEKTLPTTFMTKELRSNVEDWLIEGEIQLHSAQTKQLRRDLFSRLFGFLEENQFSECGGTELRLFFSSLTNKKTGEPLAVSTNETFRRAFNAFWRRAVKENIVSVNAMDSVPSIPAAKKSVPQVQPYGIEQIEALLKAASKSVFKKRNLALLTLILDTGLRATEICSIQTGAIDFNERSIRIKGKGDKMRTVFFGAETHKVIRIYLRTIEIESENDFVFIALSGKNAGKPLTRSGVYQIVSKLCVAAGITDGKKGPHRGRHSFATEMIRNGAYQDAVQSLLGHSNPAMTQRYVKLAGADMQKQHAQFSPVSNLNKNKR